MLGQYTNNGGPTLAQNCCAIWVHCFVCLSNEVKLHPLVAAGVVDLELAHALYGTGDTVGGSSLYGTGSFESTKQFVKWLQYVCHLRWKINQVHLFRDTNFY